MTDETVYARAAADLHTFLDAAEAMAADDTRRAIALLSRHCDDAEHYGDKVFDLAATGVSLTAAMITASDDTATGTWCFDTSLAQADHDPTMATAGVAVAAAANRDTDQVRAVLVTYAETHGVDGLIALTSLLLNIFCATREALER